MSKKKMNLVQYFLKTSPQAQHRIFTKIFPSKIDQAPSPVSDENYLFNFFNSLQYSGISNANFATVLQKNREQKQIQRFRKIFSIKQPRPGECSELQQIIQSIKQVRASMEGSTIPFQELEQRLQIASVQTLHEVRTRLIYLFKQLINSRKLIILNSLQMDANLQLSLSIISSLARIQGGSQSNLDWRQLEAMEKLVRAKQYQKKGFNNIAKNNFEEIFKNEAASSKTRLQALKMLCLEGQQMRDISFLELLMVQMKAKGQNQYTTLLMASIQKIKGYKN